MALAEMGTLVLFRREYHRSGLKTNAWKNVQDWDTLG